MITLKRYITLHLGLEWQSMKGLSGYYNNARFRDALLAGMFYQQDPLSEKYYSFSPYHYGAGNPLRFTDETGMEIVVNGSTYNIGMSYDDNDEFTQHVISALNTISDIGGKYLLIDLLKSTTKYNYIPTTQLNSYTSNADNGSVTIGLSNSLLGNKDAFYSAVAHESMHGVQYENGQGGQSIYNEVEAYVFEYTMSINSFLTDGATEFKSLGNTTNNNHAGKLYGESIQKLSLNYGAKDMNNAITHFSIGAAANNTGIYKNYPIRLGQNKQSMLQKYQIKLK